MELRKDLELVNVEYEGKKAILTFLDRERAEVRVVNFNKQIYKDGKFIDDQEKADKVETWCQEFFETTFDALPAKIGCKKDVYIYEKFNSLFELSEVRKFSADMVGQIYQTEVKEIVVDDYFIKIRYDIEGDIYESKMTFGNYVESMKQWFVDPQKKAQIYKKFEDKYLVPVERKDELIGHALMVEVKTAFGSSYWGDIKKFPRK